MKDCKEKSLIVEKKFFKYNYCNYCHLNELIRVNPIVLGVIVPLYPLRQFIKLKKIKKK